MFEELSQINIALFAPIFVIQLLLMIMALIDIVRSEETNGPKTLWYVVVLLGSMLGPIIYFVFGRKR
ncbi:PLD nuclease N-terminal domain-containing protein [Bacillus timonensis]|nr:PLD nuclease N-terminal domain-containing protein [Bacillus timonensis]